MSWDESARAFLDNIQRAGAVTSATPFLDALEAAHDAARSERKACRAGDRLIQRLAATVS